MTIAESNKEFLASEECALCPTREIALFANLKPDDFLQMHASIQYKVIEKGGKLYEHDEEADSIYTLHDGVLKLQQYLPTGEQRIVRLLGRGDLVGIEAVTTASYQHDAIAMTKISVCRIPADFVLDLSHKSREFHKSLMNKCQLTLMASDTWLTRLSTGPARYRLVRLLIWLSKSCHEEFFLPGRSDIGNMLSLNSETVSRIIAGLRRDGDIELINKDRARVDVARLNKIVKEPV